MTETVKLDVDQGVAIVTLNRPERMNAVNAAMGEAFDAAMVKAALDPAVRVIVLTGAGERAFCAGADMERLAGLAPGGSEKLSHAGPGSAVSIFDALADAPQHLRGRYTAPSAVPQPVIAAVNGACAGVGLALAAACDVRFASRTAVFVASFALRGLTAEAGIAKTLSSLIGRAAASDLLLSGRKVTAEEAYRLGLASDVAEPEALMARALDYAHAIARNASPRSTRIIKRQLREAQDQSFEAALDAARAETEASIASEDFREGVASYQAKRAPRFVGR